MSMASERGPVSERGDAPPGMTAMIYASSDVGLGNQTRVMPALGSGERVAVGAVGRASLPLRDGAGRG